MQQSLLNEGLEESGIIATDTFDYDIIDKIYTPFDNMTMMVSLKPDGTMDREVVASVARGVKADVSNETDFGYLVQTFENPSLQMVSFTITEKDMPLPISAESFFLLWKRIWKMVRKKPPMP